MQAGKILLLVNDTTYAYNTRMELISSLVQHGNDVVVVSEPSHLRNELIQETGARLIDLKVGRRGTDPFKDIRLMRSFYRILRKEKPDLVLSFNIKPNIYGGLACRMLKIPYMPNVTGLGVAVEYPGLLQVLTTRLYKWGVAGANCIFFQNEENLEFFKSRKMIAKKSKVCMLPGSGVNLTHRAMKEYPAEGPVHFLFAARIMKEKGIDLFLAAAEKYHSDNVIFEVCGSCDDEKYSQIMKKAHESGVIRYHGYQKDMNPYYERCSCFLYPSYYPEGMSNVLLETAATGRPAIAADRSGCRETVTDGVTGYIVPVKDEAAVLQAVEKFLSLTWQQRKEMGIAARAKVEKEFDRQLVVEAYLKNTQDLSVARK